MLMRACGNAHTRKSEPVEMRKLARVIAALTQLEKH